MKSCMHCISPRDTVLKTVSRGGRNRPTLTRPLSLRDSSPYATPLPTRPPPPLMHQQRHSTRGRMRMYRPSRRTQAAPGSELGTGGGWRIMCVRPRYVRRCHKRPQCYRQRQVQVNSDTGHKAVCPVSADLLTRLMPGVTPPQSGHNARSVILHG